MKDVFLFVKGDIYELQKHTLNAKNCFEMRGKLPTKEPAYVERWQNANMYERLSNRMKEKNISFSMMDLHMQMVICMLDIC